MATKALTDAERILRRKRVEQHWLQRRKGDERTPEALDELAWAFFKAGLWGLTELRAFRLSSGFYHRKLKRKSKDLACNY
jgi:hypothetical protein